MEQWRHWLGWLAALAGVVLLANWLQGAVAQRHEAVREYSDFREQVRHDQVDTVKVIHGGQLLKVQLRGVRNTVWVRGPGNLQVLSHDLEADIASRKQNPELATKSADALAQRPKVEYQPESVWNDAVRYLLLALPMLVVLGFLYLALVRHLNAGSNQAMTFNRSRARRLSDTMPRKTFDDVAGVDEAKEELSEIVDFLRHADRYQRLGAEIPKGVLLMGPPGCGKTLLARAVAGEAGVPFFHISGSDFVEMFVGVGASRVRDLFEQAKASRPCIVFIDELDAVGRQRGAGLGGGHDEREQTVNQLLVEMDGFEPNIGIIVMAATNRPDILDPALLRPGRFDRRVVVDAPDLGGRKEILALYFKAKPVADDAELDTLAQHTSGLTGADLYSIVNEASILAARNDQLKITMANFEEAIERVVAGRERRSRVLTPNERRVVAYHEAGHAVAAHFSIHCPTVHKVTILPRGMALGYVLTMPSEERFNFARAELVGRMIQGLAGRVAEELVFGAEGITTGAQNDLERVTDLARSMVCDYGMSSQVGPRTMGRRHGPVFLGRDMMEDRNYSEEMAHVIDLEIRKLVDDAYAEARSLLTDKFAALEKLVQVLLEKETLGRDELIATLGEPPEKVGLVTDELATLETEAGRRS